MPDNHKGIRVPLQCEKAMIQVDAVVRAGRQAKQAIDVAEGVEDVWPSQAHRRVRQLASQVHACLLRFRKHLL